MLSKRNLKIIDYTGNFESVSYQPIHGFVAKNILEKIGHHHMWIYRTKNFATHTHGNHIYNLATYMLHHKIYSLSELVHKKDINGYGMKELLKVVELLPMVTPMDIELPVVLIDSQAVTPLILENIRSDDVTLVDLDYKLENSEDGTDHIITYDLYAAYQVSELYKAKNIPHMILNGFPFSTKANRLIEFCRAMYAYTEYNVQPQVVSLRILRYIPRKVLPMTDKVFALLETYPHANALDYPDTRMLFFSLCRLHESLPKILKLEEHETQAITNNPAWYTQLKIPTITPYTELTHNTHVSTAKLCTLNLSNKQISELVTACEKKIQRVEICTSCKSM